MQRIQSRVRLAFTLVEMLVVIGVIVIGATVIAPGFSRMIESTNYSSAINAVTATLGQARALAIQNGRDTGVAFLFDIETEQCTLVILELDQAGGGSLNCGSNQGRPRHADVLRPALNTTPVLLPKGTIVCGLAVSTQIAPGDSTCEESFIDAETAGWYAGMRFPDPAIGTVAITPWLFPRNDPRLYMDSVDGPPFRRDTIGADPWADLQTLSEARQAVRHAQSFYIRYSPTGSAIPIAVADPDDAYIEFPDLPYDNADLGADPFDEPFCFDPESFAGSPTDPSANPEVWVRPVDQLAVVSTARLAEETGIARPWFVTPQTYLAYVGANGPGTPDYLNEMIGGGMAPEFVNDVRAQLVSDWIDGNAEVLAFNRYTGTVMKRIQR